MTRTEIMGLFDGCDSDVVNDVKEVLDDIEYQVNMINSLLGVSDVNHIESAVQAKTIVDALADDLF